jgi:hypothetical protein
MIKTSLSDSSVSDPEGAGLISMSLSGVAAAGGVCTGLFDRDSPREGDINLAARRTSFPRDFGGSDEFSTEINSGASALALNVYDDRRDT